MNSEKQPPTIEGLLDLAGDFAHQVLLEMKFAKLTPSWLLLGKDGYPYIYATEWASDYDKLAAEAFIRLKIIKHQVVMYSFVGEAYIRRVPDTYKPGDVIHKDELPKGEEIVSAIATDGKRKLAKYWLIVRNEQSGQIVGLKDEGLGDGVAGGWVDSLLDHTA